MCKKANGIDKISIVVPVYNVQDYVARCLDSILAQKHDNFEVVCIDDGSKDASGEICDEYQKKDERIRVYHIENHGVSYARNYALSLIEGEWFCFVDPDDWISPEYLSKMYELVKQNDCDIAACELHKTYEYCIKDEEKEETVFVFNSVKECIHNFICNENSMQGVSTNKLYRAAVFKDVRFNTELKVNEDCMYVYDIMLKCNKACFIPRPLYYWFIRPDSACHRRPKVADFRGANVFLMLYEKTLKEKDEAITKTLQRNYVTSVIRVLLFAKYEKKNTEVMTAKKRCKEWRKNIWTMLSIKDKLKYLYAVYSPYVFHK